MNGTFVKVSFSLLSRLAAWNRILDHGATRKSFHTSGKGKRWKFYMRQKQVQKFLSSVLTSSLHTWSDPLLNKTGRWKTLFHSNDWWKCLSLWRSKAVRSRWEKKGIERHVSWPLLCSTVGESVSFCLIPWSNCEYKNYYPGCEPV